MMKDFTGKPSFSGAYEEDLDNVLSIFDTITDMCEITPEEKLQAMPVILKGDALTLF